jgi:ubiquitin-like protein Pup
MAGQEQKRKSASGSTETIDELPAKSKTGDKIKGDLDDLLDAVDEVLETNAEEFVRGYIQKGGQ